MNLRAKAATSRSGCSDSLEAVHRSNQHYSVRSAQPDRDWACQRPGTLALTWFLAASGAGNDTFPLGRRPNLTIR